jgi:hypothetical protein
MAKRKKTTRRKSSTGRKGTATRARVRRAPIAMSATGTLAEAPESAVAEPVEGSAQLGPAAALPARPLHGSEPGADALSTLMAEPGPVPAAAAERSQAQIFERLAALLVPYALEMESEMHPRIGYCLKAHSRSTKRQVHFGAVQVLPDGVAFHLFPLYAHPELLKDASPELFTRMRGQTCFHFAELDERTLAELGELTRRGFECFLADGMA